MSRDALIVGINSYQNLPNLRAPAQDADAVARCLESFGEFRVLRLPEVIKSGKPTIGSKTGVTTRMLEEALIRLFKPTGKNIPQTAIFYYSGHGLQRNAGIREGYLATSDTHLENSNYGLSLFWLRRLLQESPVRQRIVWLDCCHSGEFLNFLEADPGAREGTDRLFMAASREYEPAYEALEGAHSVFTKALLAGLNPYKARGGVVSSHHVVEAVSTALRGEVQQPLSESSGSDIILTRASGAVAVQECANTLLDRLKQLSYAFCPYRGLQPFEEAHAAYFFGREELTRQLVHLVEQGPFCAVVGASGCGKTSLLQAGLIHHLRQAQATAGGIQWQIRQMTPDQNPLQRLAEAFIDNTPDKIQRAEQLRRAESLLQHGGQGLAQLVRATLGTESTLALPTQRLVLVIDQFEALFTAEVSPEIEATRSHFMDCLLAVMRNPALPLHLVIGMRCDRLEYLKQYPDFWAQVMEHSLTVPPMTYEQIKAVVVKPLEKVGLRFDANLIYTLMLDVVGAPGELPLLQLALQELWRRREIDISGTAAPKLTLAAYADLGGVRNLLNKRATEVYHRLSEAEQGVARRIFLSLCELGEGTEDSRRRACLSELMIPTTPTPLIEQTLDKLVEAGLVVVNRDTPPMPALEPDGVSLPEAAWSTPAPGKRDHTLSISHLLQRLHPHLPEQTAPVVTVDIVHESLIRTWPLLRSWLQESRSVVWYQRRLEAASLEWQKRGYPEHSDYLLTGTRLQEARQFQQDHCSWLSSLVQRYLAVSELQHRKNQWRRQVMRLLVPLSLATGMLSSYGQYLLSQSRMPTLPTFSIAASLPFQSARDRAATASQPTFGTPDNGWVTALFNGSHRLTTAATTLASRPPAGRSSQVSAGGKSAPKPRPHLQEVAPSQLASEQLASESAIAESAIAENVITENVITENVITENVITENVITENVIVVWCLPSAQGPICTTTQPQ